MRNKELYYTIDALLRGCQVFHGKDMENFITFRTGGIETKFIFAHEDLRIVTSRTDYGRITYLAPMVRVKYEDIVCVYLNWKMDLNIETTTDCLEFALLDF